MTHGLDDLRRAPRIETREARRPLPSAHVVLAAVADRLELARLELEQALRRRDHAVVVRVVDNEDGLAVRGRLLGEGLAVVAPTVSVRVEVEVVDVRQEGVGARALLVAVE
jgi:phage tail protein X